MRHLFLALTLFLFPMVAGAADLSFSAPVTAPVGSDFTLTVLASSTQRFNAAEATIVFPEDLVEVRSIDPASSATVFNFWLTPPSFSNKEGIIVFSGGTTRDVAGADIPLLTVHLRAKSQGSVLITAQDASINAADGSGTNILEDVHGLRLTVSQAALVVPVAPVIVPAPAAPATAAPTASIPEPILPVKRSTENCAGLFATCEVRFPTITSVSLIPHLQTGATISVSGTAVNGDRVLLRLRRDGTFYKQVEAIIQEDGTWEAVFTNIYAYGTYRVDASAHLTDEQRMSEPVAWLGIHYYPPGTFVLFDIPLYWHVLVVSALGLLTLILAGLLIVSYRATPGGSPQIRNLFIASLLASIAMSVVAYVLWNRNTPHLLFWNDTDIPCVRKIDSDSSEFGSAEFAISIDGVAQSIPAEIGITPTCVAQIHTHDDSGRLHFEVTEWSVTLADFFSVAGVDFDRVGYARMVTVNGADYTDQIVDYSLQDGDVIEVRYTEL